MAAVEIPAILRNKTLAVGADDWLDALPELVADVEARWDIVVGRPFTGGSEAYVAEATTIQGDAAVLKLLLPRSGDAVRHEITALRLADGNGCATLLRDDSEMGALLLERLGPTLYELGLPMVRRHEILCDTVAHVWRPAAGSGLPTGATKASQLIDFITRTWDKVDRPCSEQVVDHAVLCARRRAAAHDDERSVLVHGDLHQLNALRAGAEFKLIDPDGLLAEAEYDLGVLMRGDPVELLDGDPRDRAHWLATRSGLDAAAIWEWGVIERVSTGLHCEEIDLQPLGRETLMAAEAVSEIDFG